MLRVNILRKRRMNCIKEIIPSMKFAEYANSFSFLHCFIVTLNMFYNIFLEFSLFSSYWNKVEV